MITGVVAKETIGRSPFTHEGLESPEKGLRACNGFDVDNMGSPAEEDLSVGVPRVNRGRVSRDFVSEKVVVKTEHVECGVGSVPAFEEVPVG